MRVPAPHRDARSQRARLRTGEHRQHLREGGGRAGIGDPRRDGDADGGDSAAIDDERRERLLPLPVHLARYVHGDGHHAGFASLERENVIVSVGKNTDVEMPLRLSGVEETVRVSSATPLIDTRKVQTGITFSNMELQDIPTSRDIYSLMQQVPGVQIDQVNVGGAASGRVGGPDFTTKGSGGVT